MQYIACTVLLNCTVLSNTGSAFHIWLWCKQCYEGGLGCCLYGFWLYSDLSQQKACFQAKDSLHQYPQTFSHFQAKNCSHRDASFRLFLYVFPPCSIGLSDGQRSSEHLSEEKRQNFQFHRWCKRKMIFMMRTISACGNLSLSSDWKSADRISIFALALILDSET